MESIGSPPPRTVIGDPSRVDRLGQNCWVPSTSSCHCAGRRMTPSGTTPSRTSAGAPWHALPRRVHARGDPGVRSLSAGSDRARAVGAPCRDVVQTRVGRDPLALGRAQAFKSFGSFLQLGIEAADAEPDQCCFDSVDDPTLLSDEALALAVGPLAIFVLNCRDCDHLAVITLAAQPAKKGDAQTKAD